MKPAHLLIPLMALLSTAAAAQVGWSGSTLEFDCRGVETASGTVAKERACMEVVGDQILGSRFVCTASARANGRCPTSIPEDRYFPQINDQPCTDRDIPGDRGRCLYGRGPATFDNTSCLGKNDPIPECSGVGTGSAPQLPTCNEAEWGHISQDLETLSDSWCNGTSWTVVTDQQAGKWHPALFEAAERVTVANLPTCDSTNEGLAKVVTDGTGAADCTVGLSTNAHRCRCLSTVWTAETGEYRIFPPSGTLFGVAGSGGLPPCNASTNNLRAWVGPFPDHPTKPWLEGTLYRCTNPTWAANVGNYRIGENDDGLGDIARPWCKRDEWENQCWFPAPPDAANSWIEDQGQDLILRRFDFLFDKERDSGKAAIRDGTGIPTEED